MTENTMNTNNEDTPSTSDIVRVIRYIRPKDEEAYILGNKVGVTILFYIDYDAKIVTARWSICSGDEFSRKEGIRVASDQVNQGIAFPLALVDQCKGLTNALILAIAVGLFVPDERVQEYLQEIVFSKDGEFNPDCFETSYYLLHVLFLDARAALKNIAEVNEIDSPCIAVYVNIDREQSSGDYQVESRLFYRSISSTPDQIQE